MSALSHEYRSKAVDELLRGREVANQLRYLLAASGTVPADDLVGRILKSFASTLSMLDSNSGGVSRAPVSDYSGVDCCKSTLTLKEKKTCYKKRKMDDTYTRVTVDLIDDGFVWRKYGQKDIHGTPFPRNYYRCTHKFDEPGCQATKQVQQISKNPPLFRTLYRSHHTCNNLLRPPQIIFDPLPPDSSRMLCFQTNTVVDHRQDHRNDKPLKVEHECKEEIIGLDKDWSSSDHYMRDLAGPMLSPEQNANVVSSESLFEFDDFNSVADGANYYPHYQYTY